MFPFFTHAAPKEIDMFSVYLLGLFQLNVEGKPFSPRTGDQLKKRIKNIDGLPYEDVMEHIGVEPTGLEVELSENPVIKALSGFFDDSERFSGEFVSYLEDHVGSTKVLPPNITHELENTFRTLNTGISKTNKLFNVIGRTLGEKCISEIYSRKIVDAETFRTFIFAMGGEIYPAQISFHPQILGRFQKVVCG